jgi:hypothetical protein
MYVYKASKFPRDPFFGFLTFGLKIGVKFFNFLIFILKNIFAKIIWRKNWRFVQNTASF